MITVKEIKQSLYDLCVDIYAHAKLDWEVTLSGNGVNCSEASTVAEHIEKMFELKVQTEDVDKLVEVMKARGY